MRRTNHSQDVLREAIKNYTQNLRIPHAELADLANVSRPLITSFVAGRLNLSPSSLVRVQKALARIVGEKTAAIGLFMVKPPQENVEAELQA